MSYVYQWGTRNSITMPHNLAIGKRERLSLEVLEYSFVELVDREQGSMELMAWEREGTDPVQLEQMVSTLSKFYTIDREEHIGDILGLPEDVIIHIFDTEGVILVEDWNEEQTTVILERTHLEEYQETLQTVNDTHEDIEFIPKP